MTRKQSASTAIGTGISHVTAEDADQGLAHTIVNAEIDTPAPDLQERTGDATTEKKGEDHRIATVIVVKAMTARIVMTVEVVDAMIAVAVTVQISGEPSTMIGDRGVGVERRTEEEGKEIALDAEVLMRTRTTGGDLVPEKQVSSQGVKVRSNFKLGIPLTKVS